MISFAGCPILWQSKLQTQVALSTTEAEYIALSQSMRETIPIMQIFEELTRKKIVELREKPEVFCKAFEDNTGALELATVPKLRPRTKHINLVYHHFREHVRNKKIEIIKIGTEDQVGDLFTKPLAQNLFQKFRKRIMGW